MPVVPQALLLKAVLPEEIEIRDLYRLARERSVRIRRLDYKRDSLEDIFLKAMEGNSEPSSAGGQS